MPDVAITRISTRGQIVIPKKFRDKYGFKAGDHFLIFGYKDTILIKKIKILLTFFYASIRIPTGELADPGTVDG